MKAQLRLHFLVLMWGFTGVLGKLITIGALPLVFLRVSIAALSIYIYLNMIGISIKDTRKNILTVLGAGCIIGLHWIFFFGAIKVSNVSVALSTLATGALFTAFLEPIFFKRKLSLSEVLMSLAVIACLYFIFDTNPQYTLGIAMGIFCSFLSALFTVINAKIRPRYIPSKMAFYEMLGATGLVGIALLFTGEYTEIFHTNTEDWIWLLILSTLITAFPMIESVRLFKYLKPFNMLLAINLEPVYGIILAYLIFGDSELMSGTFYIASLVMLLIIVFYEGRNIYIRNQEKKKNKQKIQIEL